MSYTGSYMWKLRQKVPGMTIITTTVDVLPINDKGEVKLVYAPHVNGWSCVGGHAELGDSWQSAACHELEEEAGIIAKPEKLIPFAAISGPERIFHYRDGDTQPFTLCFFVKDWEKESKQTDVEEVPMNGWFPLDEALEMETTPWCHAILHGYKKYSESGEFQMIEDKR